MKFVPKFQSDSNPLGTALELWNWAKPFQSVGTLFQHYSNLKNQIGTVDNF
jgi:hypothetical protein